MELKEGYIEDYISGTPVRATPEEIEAVQVFSKMLVEDYGYPKELIRTRPQWRVKSRPSDARKEYPIDIGIFLEKEQLDDNIQILVFGLTDQNAFFYKKLKKMEELNSQTSLTFQDMENALRILENLKERI
jgi:hypothetical protein